LGAQAPEARYRAGGGENVNESAKSKNDVPLETSIPGASLKSILCTEELQRRSLRPPDYGNENRALVALASALADSPRTILQTLAEKVLEVLQADSAGLSLLTKDEKRFYWAAIAGAWQQHIGGGTPRDFGPCGDVLDRNVPMLFTHWERRYRVLGTSARKPPLSDTFLGAILSLAHPFKIEVILSKRVDVLPKQRGCEAQNIVVDHLAFSAELADYRPDVQRIPSNNSVVQHRQTTERVDLIAELASSQRALLAKAEESRQVVRSLTFVKFAAHSSAIFLVIQSS
jgi:hypothetical protein